MSMEMPSGVKMETELRPNEVKLKNIPTWKKLPDVDEIGKQFGFEKIHTSEIRGGRSLADFVPLREETLPAFREKEVLDTAMIFDLSKLIDDKYEKEGENYISLDEVLEAIKKAGYRPATLQELLAYARDYWKPDADPKSLNEEQKRLQKGIRSTEARIVALGSVTDSSDGGRVAPHIQWEAEHDTLSGDERRRLRTLGTDGISIVGERDNFPLVVRSENSETDEEYAKRKDEINDRENSELYEAAELVSAELERLGVPKEAVLKNKDNIIMVIATPNKMLHGNREDVALVDGKKWDELAARLKNLKGW